MSGSNDDRDTKPASKPAPERRASRRVELCTPVKVSSVSDHVGVSGDVSTDGIFIGLEEPLPEGSLVDVEFCLPGTEEELQLVGEVRWARNPDDPDGGGLGVEFWHEEDSDRDSIREYVDSDVWEDEESEAASDDTDGAADEE